MVKAVVLKPRVAAGVANPIAMIFIDDWMSLFLKPSREFSGKVASVLSTSYIYVQKLLLNKEEALDFLISLGLFQCSVEDPPKTTVSSGIARSDRVTALKLSVKFVTATWPYLNLFVWTARWNALLNLSFFL